MDGEYGVPLTAVDRTNIRVGRRTYSCSRGHVWQAPSSVYAGNGTIRMGAQGVSNVAGKPAVLDSGDRCILCVIELLAERAGLVREVEPETAPPAVP